LIEITPDIWQEGILLQKYCTNNYEDCYKSPLIGVEVFILKQKKILIEADTPSICQE
jgi:hypothetical protein